MDLSELEATSGRLLEDQKRLRSIESELEMLKREIREMPRREQKDKSFYALIGLNYEDPGHSDREQTLKKERETVLASIHESEDKIMKGLSSQGLVVPLDPTPIVVGNTFTFKYRAQATFPKTLEELNELLGLSTPIQIGPVMIYPDKIVAVEADQYFAKQKIVEAFENIRKAVNLRLTQRQ
jgi:histidinol phosphatase-like PHP family hydrolase